MKRKIEREPEHICPQCGRPTTYKGLFDDDEESECMDCEGDNNTQSCWERDNFGDN
jgi:hypothetical protein